MLLWYRYSAYAGHGFTFQIKKFEQHSIAEQKMTEAVRDIADQYNFDGSPASGIDAPAPLPTAPYSLRIIGKPVLNDSGAVEGIVRNTSAVDWGASHRVGVRLRDACGNIIPGYELRADFQPAPPPAGEKAYFCFDLRIRDIAAATVSATLDVVEEGVKWLSEVGGEPANIPVRTSITNHSSEWLFWLDGLGYSGDARLSLIERLVAKIPTIHSSKGHELHRLFDTEAEDGWYEPFRTDSETVAAATSNLGDWDGRDLYLRHLVIQAGRRIDPTISEGAAQFFDQFTLEAASRFGSMTAPLALDICKWLSQRALPQAIASTPATRSMIATLAKVSPFDLNPGDGGQAQIWKFATEVMIDRNVTAAAMPPTVLRALTSASTNERLQDFPPVTSFMSRIHRDSSAYCAAYHLKNGEDRLAFAIDLSLASLENESFRVLLGPEIRGWLDEPLALPSDICPLEVILLIASGRAPPAADDPDPVDLQRLRRAFGWIGSKHGIVTDNSLRIIGLHSSSSGLGANMRMSETVLRNLGVPIELIDTRRNRVLPADVASATMELPRPIDLFHLNFDEVPALVGRYARRDRPNTYRIGFALWESSSMPEEHRVGLELINEIWAPTTYVADVYRDAGHPNVHVVGKGIDLPDPIAFELSTLGISSNSNVFLVAFDIESWVDRKNPMAAVDAFQLAFSNDPEARLIIKSNGLISHRGDRTSQVSRLEAAVQADNRIILLSEFLPFPKYLGLIQAVTATISPHRAEGFGYFPAYSMLLGTPAIVTDYSGTVDFCSEETGYPVRAELIALQPGDFVFDAFGATWANIDVAHLADQMRNVVDDPVAAAARTERGAALVRSKYSMAALQERYRARLAEIQ